MSAGEGVRWPTPDWGGAAPLREWGRPAAVPEDFLVWSVLATILCFPPTGVAALLWGRRVHARFAAGDLAGAAAASRQARGWLALTVCCGVLVYGLVFVAAFVLGAAGGL